MSKTKSNILERVVLEIRGVKIHPKEITSLSFERGGDRFNACANPHKQSEFVVVDPDGEVVSGNEVVSDEVVSGISFSVGDVVTRKNDGVKMKIESIGQTVFGVRLPKGHVVCVWFAGIEVHREVLPVESLITESQVVGGDVVSEASESSGFSVGDLVCLNSGGPKMTVGIITEKAVHCCWFNGGQYFESKFVKSALIAVAGSIPDLSLIHI